MTSLPKVLEFEWDEGNLDKSYQRHGVLSKESESVFIDEKAFVFRDVRHSETEERFVILGRSQESNKMMFIVFTMRGEKIRIISARRMGWKEVEKYEKAKKGTKI